MLSKSQATNVADTLRASLVQAAGALQDGQLRESFAKAGGLLGVRATEAQDVHAALPAVGTVTQRKLIIEREDTAAAMGHPDQSLAVLGSPRIALWFEQVASQMLPDPTPKLTHVGVGILVHHLGRADVGEPVTLEAVVETTRGRHIMFSCTAMSGDKLLALGVHHRVMLDADG